MYTIIFNETYAYNYIKNFLCCHFYLGITVRLITSRNSAAKIILQPFRNNKKIVIYE